jgi:glucose/arabinose dehydrogenase
MVVRMRIERPLLFGALLGALSTLPALPAGAQRLPGGLVVDTLASGLAAPVALDFLPDGRVLFAEQNTGLVRVFRTGAGVQTTPVLQVPQVATGGERGLLGLAVDPGFPARPYLYVIHSASSPNHTRVARFTLTGDLTGAGTVDLTADPDSRYDLLDAIPDQASNHNGGTVRFAPDGTLIVSLGEDAVPCAAQDSTSLRGVLLRLETRALPPGPGLAFFGQLAPTDNPFAAAADSSLRLVLALGLRNPFRVQVDSVTAQVVIADVGENVREELDLLALPGATPGTLGSAAAGADFGWPYLEGTAPGVHRLDCAPEPGGLVGPVHEYDRSGQLGGAAIIAAGYLWFPATTDLMALPTRYEGNLFFSDYYSGVVVRLSFGAVNGSLGWFVASPESGQPDADHWGVGFAHVADWRQGPDGALWFCRQSDDGFAAGTGVLGRIRSATAPSPSQTPLVLRLLNSPAVGSATLRFETSPGTDAHVTLLDASGRVVRRWGPGEFSRVPEGRGVFWDGRDREGNPAHPGLYLARLESEGRSAVARVPFLR